MSRMIERLRMRRATSHEPMDFVPSVPRTRTTGDGHAGWGAAAARAVVRGVTVGAVVVRTGVGVVTVSVLARLLGPAWPARRSGPERLRRMFEQLGPTFTKLGQLLAGRPEIVPASYRAELARLRDHVAPMPSAAAVMVVQRAYSRSLAETFASFCLEPIASASIGQVHRATLPDGREVAVKVRRPEVAVLIESDLTVIGAIARFIHRLVPPLRPYELPALVSEFAAAIRQELDYELEASHAASVAASLEQFDWVRVPATIATLCRPDVLVMEYVEGIPLSDVDRLAAAGFDRTVVGGLVIAASLRLILFSDVFQADPHAGNFLVAPDGRLVLLDFGQTGRSDEATRTSLVMLLSGLVARDAARVAEAIVTICNVDPEGSEALVADLSDFVAALSEIALGSVRIGAVLRDLMTLLRRHHLRFRSDTAMLIKAAFEFEATAEELDSGLRLLDVLPLALGLAEPQAALLKAA